MMNRSTKINKLIEAYLGYSYGLQDIKGIKPGGKDIGRMKDIVDKSGNDTAKMLALVTKMANSITKVDKAQRRAAAALQVLPRSIGKEAAMIFLAKF